MFGKKKEKTPPKGVALDKKATGNETPDGGGGSGDYERERRLSYAEAWGAYASAARFRGIIAFLAILAVLASSSAVFMQTKAFRPVIIAVDSDGRPELMRQTELKVNRDLFVKDFIDNLYNYMPTNVEEKAVVALNMMTQPLRKAWSATMGTDWTRLVKANDVLQIMSVRSVEITAIGPTSFTAVVRGQMVRSERRTDNVSTKDGVITVEVVNGAISASNPWGLYVDVLRDETVDAIKR